MMNPVPFNMTLKDVLIRVVSLGVLVFAGCDASGTCECGPRSPAAAGNVPASSPGPRIELSPDFLKDLKITIIDDQIIAASTRKEVELIETSVGASLAPGSLIRCIVVMPVGDVKSQKPMVSDLGNRADHLVSVVYIGTDWSKCDSAVILECDRDGHMTRSDLTYHDGKWWRRRAPVIGH